MLIDYKKIKEILDNPETPKVVIIKSNENKELKNDLINGLVNEIKKENKKWKGEKQWKTL